MSEFEKFNWHETLLDSLQMPLSVTDLEKNIVFVNAAALAMLRKTVHDRKDIIGKKCSKVFNISICGDERCGVESLKRGENSIIFKMGGGTFNSYQDYIKDGSGNNIGHFEIVTDLTEKSQKSAYVEKEMQRLIENLSKMAEGKKDLDLSIEPPDDFTEEEYERFEVIKSKLEGILQKLS